MPLTPVALIALYIIFSLLPLIALLATRFSQRIRHLSRPILFGILGALPAYLIASALYTALHPIVLKFLHPDGIATTSVSTPFFYFAITYLPIALIAYALGFLISFKFRKKKRTHAPSPQ